MRNGETTRFSLVRLVQHTKNEISARFFFSFAIIKWVHCFYILFDHLGAAETLLSSDWSNLYVGSASSVRPARIRVSTGAISVALIKYKHIAEVFLHNSCCPTGIDLSPFNVGHIMLTQIISLCIVV